MWRHGDVVIDGAWRHGVVRMQGYSGMNRFNKGNWSMVQNSMVMAYLSYADFYRPRYWLLENVRNFVSHNKSHTFRLTLRTLLDIGYQVLLLCQLVRPSRRFRNCRQQFCVLVY